MSSILRGNKINVSVFGQSHSEAIGCVIDGLPAGVKLDTLSIENLWREEHRVAINIRQRAARRTSP